MAIYPSKECLDCGETLGIYGNYERCLDCNRKKIEALEKENDQLKKELTSRPQMTGAEVH